MEISQKKKVVSKARKALDTPGPKRGRGRPKRVGPQEVIGRGMNYRLCLKQVWDVVGELLLKAQTEVDVIQAFKKTAYEREFENIASLFLAVLRDPAFPKKRSKAQANFLADSLAARGEVSFRRSRDICAEGRAIERSKSPHRILRHEYYVECSCGYKGPARDGACRKCGAAIPMFESILSGSGFA